MFLSEVTHNLSLQSRALGQQVTALREAKILCVCVGGQVKSVLLGLNEPIKYMSESDRQLINLHALHLAEATILLIQLIYNAKTHLLVPVVTPMCEVIVSLQTFGKGRRVLPCSPISTKHIHALCPQPTARSPLLLFASGPRCTATLRTWMEPSPLLIKNILQPSSLYGTTKESASRHSAVRLSLSSLPVY